MSIDESQNHPKKALLKRGPRAKSPRRVPTPEEIVHEVCHANLVWGLSEISKFKHHILPINPNGLLGLYLLCLCELTFHESPQKDQKDQVRRINAVLEHILNKSGIEFPVQYEHKILPCAVVFKMACIWNKLGVDFAFFYSFGTSRVQFRWMKQLPCLTPSEASVLHDVLLTLQRYDNGNLWGPMFDDWIGKIETLVSVKLAENGYFEDALAWIRRIHGRNYPPELAMAGVASAYATHNRTDLAGEIMSKLLETPLDAIKGYFKVGSIKEHQEEIVISFFKQNLIPEAKKYITLIEDLEHKNYLWSVLAYNLAERLEIRESLYCLEQRQYTLGRKFSWQSTVDWDLEIADICSANNCKTNALSLLNNLELLSEGVTIDSDNRRIMARLSTSFWKADDIYRSGRCMEKAMPQKQSEEERVKNSTNEFSDELEFDYSMVDLVEELMKQNKPVTALLCIEEIRSSQDCRNEAYFHMAECMAEIGLRREMKFFLDKIDIENIDFYPAKSAIALYRQFGVDESFECLRHPNICIEGMRALITHLALQGDYDKAFYTYKRFMLEEFLTKDYLLDLGFLN